MRLSVLVISSNSGGGTPGNSTLLVLAAYAIASSPYGTPNLWNASLLEINLTCSGVGPVLGYVNSVRTRVCESGAEIELREIIEGEVRLAAWL